MSQLPYAIRRLLTRLVTILGVLVMAALPAIAESSTYTENFESYLRHSNVETWIDSRLDAAAADARGLFATAPDPLLPDNTVYGTGAVGAVRLHGVRQGGVPRVGVVSTLTAPPLQSGGTFTGRVLVENAESRVGFTLLSGLPNRDAYVLIGLAPSTRPGVITLRAVAWDEARGGDVTDRLEGELDSGVSIDPKTWYRFDIRIEESPGATVILARFWPEVDSKPDVWQIRAVDSGAQRLGYGRVGMWAAGRGGCWIDDLEIITTPVEDLEAPRISIFESGNTFLDQSIFNRDVLPDIRVEDDDPSPLVSIELDERPFTAGAVVVDEGEHVLRVVVVDRAGKRAERVVRFAIDKTAPLGHPRTVPPGDLVTGTQVTHRALLC